LLLVSDETGTDMDLHRTPALSQTPPQQGRQRPREYFLECTHCLASARVTLEMLAPVAGALRCLSCGRDRVVVKEAAQTA
jgi:predicted Zn finger-like uncharacterized protein